MALTKEQLLAEVEDLLRTMPSMAKIRESLPENYAWMGRAAAVIEKWQPTKTFGLRLSFQKATNIRLGPDGYTEIAVLLHEARSALRMETVGPVSVAIDHGMVFDYFDEIRKTIETAKQDLLFVDPYLDAEFVSRYLGHIGAGVTIRLLAREKLVILLPAVDAFVQQSQANLQVRSAPNFHDRYIFVDHAECYQSGASFKDGAKRAPTTLTQITDAFGAMRQTYESMWASAKVER